MAKKLPRGIQHAGNEKAFLKTIGKNISRMASQKGISIERLAYESGVSKGYLYDVVKGEGNPSALFLLKISESLGVTVQALIK